jgi:hypothetical protein
VAESGCAKGIIWFPSPPENLIPNLRTKAKEISILAHFLLAKGAFLKNHPIYAQIKCVNQFKTVHS